MRRPLTALFIALLVAALFPFTAIAGVPAPEDTTATTDEDTAVGIELRATDDSGADVTAFTPSDPAHGALFSAGSIDCDLPTEHECSETFTYTPDDDYNGPDSFTFTATSDGSASVPANVSITVAGSTTSHRSPRASTSSPPTSGRRRGPGGRQTSPMVAANWTTWRSCWCR